MLFIVLIIVGCLGYAMIHAAATSPGKNLANKFAALGDVPGLALADVISSVGQPVSVSSMPGGNKLVQWTATGYHVAMSFDSDNICLGIDHEYLAR